MNECLCFPGNTLFQAMYVLHMNDRKLAKETCANVTTLLSGRKVKSLDPVTSYVLLTQKSNSERNRRKIENTLNEIATRCECH